MSPTAIAAAAAATITTTGTAAAAISAQLILYKYISDENSLYIAHAAVNTLTFTEINASVHDNKKSSLKFAAN